MLNHPISARDAWRPARGEHRRGGEPLRADEALLRVVVEGAAEGERREEHASHREEEGISADLDLDRAKKQDSRMIRKRCFFWEKREQYTHAPFMPGGKTGKQQSIHVCILANKISGADCSLQERKDSDKFREHVYTTGSFA